MDKKLALGQLNNILSDCMELRDMANSCLLLGLDNLGDKLTRMVRSIEANTHQVYNQIGHKQ